MAYGKGCRTGVEGEPKGYVTDIPLAKNFVLKLPDGLSHYLTKIGVASDFTYVSQWQETWS